VLRTARRTLLGVSVHRRGVAGFHPFRMTTAGPAAVDTHDVAPYAEGRKFMTTQAEQFSSGVEERGRRGAEAAERAPRSSHAVWEQSGDRPDPVELLVEQNRTRETDLVPVRHGRMMVSPFTFYRGAAKIMASDLAGTPTAGLTVQLCGDAHLSNFGGFASPERQLLFGLNDFDETLPGPFEYDVKRMAASFTIAARNNGFPSKSVRAVTQESVRAYRSAMAEFAGMRTLNVWYARMSETDIKDALDTVQRQISGETGKARSSKKDGKQKDAAKSAKLSKAEAAQLAERAAQLTKAMRKAHTRDSLHALSRFAEVVDGQYRIASQPPVVVPLRELHGAWGLSEGEIREVVEDQFRAYQESLSADRRLLLERFRIVDVARKVVGVGSVGTRAFMVLLEGRDTGDPLFLQVKEATRSVLEAHLPKSRFRNPGQRVVEGQRLMQSASDIFLGWTKGAQDDRFYYWRQLRDMKASAVVETMTPIALTMYARMCGWTLAHAHARSGDPVALTGYLGDDDAFDLAITEFSARYADQNDRDYRAFVQAVEDGRIDAVQGV
jgi:uncharacterized protein (DUF2252 family)